MAFSTGRICRRGTGAGTVLSIGLLVVADDVGDDVDRLGGGVAAGVVDLEFAVRADLDLDRTPLDEPFAMR